MDSPTPKFEMPPPGTPLFPLSPERVNGTRTPFGERQNVKSPLMMRADLTASPSLPTFSLEQALKPHVRTNSDVQGMVARFNSLEINDHAELRRRDEVALKKAQASQELAEGDLQRAREECRRMKKELEEGRDRERRVAKRVEALMEDLQQSKETHAHAQGLYEKETRKARKEAYKSSSLLVKLQEELRGTKNRLAVAKDNLEAEKLKTTRREQEAFSAQYQLVGVQEALAKMVEQMKVVESERDVLKTSLKEDEVSRIAAEGSLALPAIQDDEFASPKKSPIKQHVDANASEDKENLMPATAIELTKLREQLGRERRRRVKAEDTVDFLKMECKFQRCTCRLHEMKATKVKPKRIGSAPDAMDVDNIASEPHTATSFDTNMHGWFSYSPDTGNYRTSRGEVEEDIVPNGDFEESPVKSASFTDDDTMIIGKPAFVMAQGAENVSPIEERCSTPPACILQTEPAGVDVESHMAGFEMVEETFTLADDSSTPRQSLAFDDPTIAIPPTPAFLAHLDTTIHFEQPAAIQTPPSPTIREIVTKTTTIPMNFTPQPNKTPKPLTLEAPDLFSNAPSLEPASPSPSTLGSPIIDRARALQQIAERRGRARSVAAGLTTPRKPLINSAESSSVAPETVGAVAERREVSAPNMGTVSKSNAKGDREAVLRDLRDGTGKVKGRKEGRIRATSRARERNADEDDEKTARTTSARRVTRSASRGRPAGGNGSGAR